MKINNFTIVTQRQTMQNHILKKLKSLMKRCQYGKIQITTIGNPAKAPSRVAYIKLFSLCYFGAKN